MIVWRDKFLATGVHFLVTLTLAACAAAIIFLVWYPDPFETMIGGTELFMLVVGCDLALGPLLSLVVYDRRKSRRALITDYSIIGVVQIAALVYGVHTLAAARPVYVAFNHDRLEVVSAQEIPEQELADAKTPVFYRALPLTGPRFVSIKVPAAEQLDVLMQSVGGNDTHLRPRFYAPYEAQLEQIRARAKTLEELEKRHPERKSLLQAASATLGVPAERVRWLPVHHRKGFWTVLIDRENGRPLTYVDFDPY
jgi:hypothetical protein